MTNKTLKFVLVKNNLPAAKEPYNGQFVSNGTTWLDGFCEKICKGRTNIDAPTLKLILRTAFAFIAEDMAENVFRYNTGLLTFEPAIEGSLPSMDAPLTEANPLSVGVRLAVELTREIAGIVPARETDDAIRVRVDDVLDLAADVRQQVTGMSRFQVTGHNISARGDGEGLEILDAEGVRHACQIVEEDGMGQRIVAEAMSEPAPGKGQVLLTTRGYATPDAEPEMLKKIVTVKAAATPEPTPIFENKALGIKLTAIKPTSGETLTFGEPWRLEGEGLAESDGSRGGFRTIDWQCGGREGGAMMSFAADGKSGTLELVDVGGIAGGTHELTLKISTEDDEGMPSASGEVKLTVVK